MGKLIKSVIDQSIVKDKDYFIWDSEVKGFGCRIWPSRKKTYMFVYRSPLTQKKIFLKIGVHGNITVDEARTEAKKLSGIVASGQDPKEQKQEKIVEQKQSILFGDFFEIFQDKYFDRAYKKNTQRALYSYKRVHILPYFQQKQLHDISSQDIRQFLHSLSHQTTTANRCFALLRMVFRKAEEWEYLPAHSNPCVRIAKYKENKKQRFLSRQELLKLEEALCEQERERKSAYCAVNVVRLLLYTGCRLGEILNLKWEDVHLKEKYIHLSDTKTGESARPLNQKAIDLLKTLIKQDENPYVFYGRVSGTRLTTIQFTWSNILKLSGIKNLRIHDLRHSFASFSLAQGVDLYTVSKLLGHKNIVTTTRYAHLELEKLKDASNKMSEVFG
ncbi:tyrosine recombinase XerC [Caedimonas varicaedens]|uniref:Tyrosine recombinase XerC n=1 Tax=Caedimonas varicaedens TaxID=1629334 RepID=A0A0K8MCB1_9PROT|nr:tyrosine recombinase XerC [Caedimonas varicaedens]